MRQLGSIGRVDLRQFKARRLIRVMSDQWLPVRAQQFRPGVRQFNATPPIMLWAKEAGHANSQLETAQTRASDDWS